MLVPIGILILYTLLIPLSFCFAYDRKPTLFLDHLPLWIFGSGAFSWGFINSCIAVPYFLGWYVPRGPEAVFALFFGWLYLWIASLPVLMIFFAIRFLKRLFFSIVLLLPVLAMGNAGVFRGSGQTPHLDSSAEIQMVEEEVVMIPMRGNYPIDGSCRNLDSMKYHCTFKLRNLSDQAVTVPVGFPLSTEAVHFRNVNEINQAEVVGRFGFVAGTRDFTYPVRYVPYDREKKFSSLFLWKMTFQPREEIQLIVRYSMEGYRGLYSTRKREFQDRADNTLSVLEYGAGQAHIYVTETGGCWAGKIEKAVFRYYPFEFEEYLKRRGIGEEPVETYAQRLQELQNDPEGRRMLTWHHPLVRCWTPRFDQWKLVTPQRGVPYLELVREPFEPKPGDSIQIAYAYPTVPATPTEFDQLIAELQDGLKKNEADRKPQFAVRKNLADAIREFYGIETGNPEIRDFLETQLWYPVTEPPPVSAQMRLYLEQMSASE